MFPVSSENAMYNQWISKSTLSLFSGLRIFLAVFEGDGFIIFQVLEDGQIRREVEFFDTMPDAPCIGCLPTLSEK